MKTKFVVLLIKWLWVAAFVFVAYSLCAQNPTFDFSNPESLFSGVDALYSAFVVIGGYASRFIPFLNRITNGTYRVLAWAVVCGIGFYVFGGAKIVNLAISYAMSTSLYEVVLKWFNKKPKA